MAMVAATLATQLLALAPSSNPATAKTALANAYGTYALTANALTPILPAAFPAAIAAMDAAMSFAEGTYTNAAAEFRSGVIAFWNYVRDNVALFFAGATVMTRQPFSGFTAGLASILEANCTGNLDLASATNAMATYIHGYTIVGGTVTTNPGAVVTPII